MDPYNCPAQGCSFPVLPHNRHLHLLMYHPEFLLYCPDLDCPHTFATEIQRASHIRYVHPELLEYPDPVPNNHLGFHTNVSTPASAGSYDYEYSEVSSVGNQWIPQDQRPGNEPPAASSPHYYMQNENKDENRMRYRCAMHGCGMECSTEEEVRGHVARHAVPELSAERHGTMESRVRALLDQGPLELVKGGL